MNDATEIENKKTLAQHRYQFSGQSSKKGIQSRETDELFQKPTELLQNNDKWKSSINESVNETLAKIQAQQDAIQGELENVLLMRELVTEGRKEINLQVQVITLSKFRNGKQISKYQSKSFKTWKAIIFLKPNLVLQNLIKKIL